MFSPNVKSKEISDVHGTYAQIEILHHHCKKKIQEIKNILLQIYFLINLNLNASVSCDYSK